MSQSRVESIATATVQGTGMEDKVLAAVEVYRFARRYYAIRSSDDIRILDMAPLGGRDSGWAFRVQITEQPTGRGARK